MKLLSVDPGLLNTGFAIIERDETRTKLIHAEVIRLKQKHSIPKRLYDIYFKLFEVIHENDITDLAIETPFLGRNAGTFIKLGYVRGLLYLLAEVHGLKIHEYSPQQIKKTITGSGSSSKDEVRDRVIALFNAKHLPKQYDMSDAIAVGLCAIWQNYKR